MPRSWSTEDKVEGEEKAAFFPQQTEKSLLSTDLEAKQHFSYKEDTPGFKTGLLPAEDASTVDLLPCWEE